MSIRVKLDLKGFDRMDPLVKLGINRGLEKIGKMIERDAKIFAPVQFGPLRASINSKRIAMKVIIKDNVHYGIYQELGTRFMRAQPFMKPALLKNLPNAVKVIAREIKGVLK